MIFKPSPNYSARALTHLMHLLNAIDQFSLASGEGEVTVTEGWRPPRKGKPSFHPRGQAADIRCNDKPAYWIDGVAMIIRGFKEMDARIQYDLHPELKGKPEIHIHIEYDTGNPI